MTGLRETWIKPDDLYGAILFDVVFYLLQFSSLQSSRSDLRTSLKYTLAWGESLFHSSDEVIHLNNIRMLEYTLKVLFVPATLPPVYTVGHFLMQPQLKRGKYKVLHARKYSRIQPELIQSISRLS